MKWEDFQDYGSDPHPEESEEEQMLRQEIVAGRVVQDRATRLGRERLAMGITALLSVFVVGGVVLSHSGSTSSSMTTSLRQAVDEHASVAVGKQLEDAGVVITAKLPVMIQQGPTSDTVQIVQLATNEEPVPVDQGVEVPGVAVPEVSGHGIALPPSEEAQTGEVLVPPSAPEVAESSPVAQPESVDDQVTTTNDVEPENKTPVDISPAGEPSVDKVATEEEEVSTVEDVPQSPPDSPATEPEVPMSDVTGNNDAVGNTPNTDDGDYTAEEPDNDFEDNP